MADPKGARPPRKPIVLTQGSDSRNDVLEVRGQLRRLVSNCNKPDDRYALRRAHEMLGRLFERVRRGEEALGRQADTANWMIQQLRAERDEARRAAGEPTA